LVIAVLAALVLAAFAITARDRIGLAACKPLYDAARTAADTLAVDARMPPLEGSRKSVGTTVTCGILRRTAEARENR
jgi:hypothetical protein